MEKIIILLIFLMITASSFSQKVVGTLKISAGEFDRINSVIQISVPKNITSKNLWVTSEGKKVSPIQIGEDQIGYAIISIEKGKNKTYQLIKEAGEKSKVTIKTGSEEIKFLVEDKQVIGFKTGKGKLPEGIDSIFRRGGYIHPVLSPSGIQVSDDYPLNHKHHHGIWAAWTKTEFEGRQPDFWNMGQKTGTVLLEKVSETKEGTVFSSLKSKQGYYDLSVNPKKRVLDEEWEVRVFNIAGGAKPYYIFDLKIIQKCSGRSALTLPKYHYGGVGFRGNPQWDGAENTVFLTSEGKSRTDGHATQANWCHVGGKVDGRWTGITVMCHPENFRAPQPIRIHPTEPFLNFAPSQSGDWEITPGKTYQANYRFLVYDGEPDLEMIKKIWSDYANPLRVELSVH